MTKPQIYLTDPHPVFRPGDAHYRFKAMCGKLTVDGTTAPNALLALARALRLAADQAEAMATTALAGHSSSRPSDRQK